MAVTKPYIGRREAVGLGIEATPGTAVAPQIWLRWLEQSLQNRTTTIENDSAMGVVDVVNDSEIVEKYAEGTIGGKVTEEGIGFLLLGFFGSVSTGAASSGIYPHTFSVNQSSEPKTLTIARSGPLVGVRHPYGTFDNLEITAEAGGWVQVSTAVKARIGVSASDTPAFVTEAEFTSKHITAKLAANIAGLAGATALKGRSVRLTLERPSDSFYGLGTDDTPEHDRLGLRVRGEIVIRYTDTQYETDYLANAIKALQISLVNGTKELTFTAGKVRYAELEKSDGRDEIVTQTLGFTCQLDTSTSKTIEAVLKNARAGYVAA